MSKAPLEETVQYLFFNIDEEIYALETYYIQEIIDFTKITKVPNTHKALKGVINVRGELLALIDPKVRFNDTFLNIDKKTSFIIVKFDYEQNENKKQVTAAFMVNAVIEVEEIEKANITPVLQFGLKIEQRFVKNLIKKGNEHICSLNIENLLNIKELSKAI